MVSPMKSQDDGEGSQHSENKKSKNRHLVIINQLRKKEDAWDNRFYLQNIPEYNCTDDRHCETYQKILYKKKSRKFVLKKEIKGHPSANIANIRRKADDSGIEGHFRRPESQDKHHDFRLRGISTNEIKSREKTRAESMRRYTPLTETQLKEKRLQQEKLLATWERLNIPVFHRETFIKCENPQNVKQTIEILKKEIDELETNCAPIQLALRAITARENCLRQLKSLINRLENLNNPNGGQSHQDLATEEELKQKASELLTHVRILSLNAVETVLKWREYIQQTYYITRGVVKANQTIIIPFLYNDSNYLIKMKNDTKDIIETPLAKYFNFSSKSDPFLVYPSKEMEHADDKIILYISKNLINRIRACELVILEESVHEHMNEKNHGNSMTKGPIESPSDRSLNKNDSEAAPKKSSTGIKIRNTSLATGSAKVKRNTTGTAGNSAVKKSSNSQQGSRNQLSEQDVDNKKDAQPHQQVAEHQQKPEHKPQEPEKERAKTPVQPVKKEVEQEAVKSPLQREAETPNTDTSPKKVDQPQGAKSEYVQPVDLYEDEVEEYMNKYLDKIDGSMRESFISEPKTLLERANLGQDPIWFEMQDLNDTSKRGGFAVTHIDNTIFTARRMVILHFTTENKDNYQELLGKLVEYLWTNDECNEIKISLYYIEDESGNLGADKPLQNAIKALGFRWKQLTNDKNTGKRYIDYIMKRPENIQSLVQKYNDEPIHVKSVVVLSDLQGETVANKQPKYLFDNRYAVLTAALKHCEEKLEKLGESDSKRHQNYLKVISTLIKEGGRGKIGGLSEKFQNLQEMEAFVGEKLEDKNEYLPSIDSQHATNIFTTSLLNLIYRWKSFNVTHHKVAGKDRKYLKINNNSDLVQFQSKYKSTPLYFIPTDDHNVNVFITDNDAIINDILGQEDIIEDVVSKLFAKLDRNPTPFQEDLWLPIFSIKEKAIDLEAAKTLLKDEYKVNYATNTCTIGLNGSRVPGNLKVRPSEKSKIIEKPFLFGILHEQVDFPLFAVVVKPEDFAHHE